MKSILIISYYYPPCNSVGAFRIKSFAENWSNQGNNVSVITKHWNGDENSWSDFLESSSQSSLKIVKTNLLNVHYLPYLKPEKTKSKLTALYKIINGKFNTEIDTNQFKDYAIKFLKANAFDVIFCSSPPLNIISLGYELHKQFNIPLVIDLRDYENRTVLKKTNSQSIKTRIDTFFKDYYLNKWITSSLFYSTVTESISDYINNFSKQDFIIIYNGYDELLIRSIKKKLNCTSTVFRISTLGSIYKEQDLSIFLDAIKHFIQVKKPADFKIYFIGVNSIKEVLNDIDKYELSNYIITYPRIPHDKSIEFGLKSEILFYPGWKGYRGIYSAKIFEYLGLKKNILIAPGDDNVIDELILKSKAGKVASNSKDVYNIILDWYDEWKINNRVKYNGNEPFIKSFSRSNQSRKLLNKINQFFKNEN